MKPSLPLFLLLFTAHLCVDGGIIKGIPHMKKHRDFVQGQIGGLRYRRPKFPIVRMQRASFQDIAVKIFPWPQNPENSYLEVFEKQFRETHDLHFDNIEPYGSRKEKPLYDEVEVRSYWKNDKNRKENKCVFTLIRNDFNGIQIESRGKEPLPQARICLRRIADAIANPPQKREPNPNLFFLGKHNLSRIENKEAKAFEAYENELNDRFFSISYTTRSDSENFPYRTQAQNLILQAIHDIASFAQFGAKVTRKAERVLCGMRGYEFVTDRQEGERNNRQIEFQWQFQGRPQTRPSVNVEVKIIMKSKNGSIRDELDIWDAILESVERIY